MQNIKKYDQIEVINYKFSFNDYLMLKSIQHIQAISEKIDNDINKPYSNIIY